MLKSPSILFSTNHQKSSYSAAAPDLDINGLTADSQSSIRFLGVWIDENVTWRDHINTVERKIAKYIGLLYQGMHYLNENCLSTYLSKLCKHSMG